MKKAEFVKQTGWCFEAFAIGRLRVQLRWEMFRFSPEKADLKIGVPLLSKIRFYPIALTRSQIWRREIFGRLKIIF